MYVSILIILYFTALSLILPYAQTAFESTVIDNNVDGALTNSGSVSDTISIFDGFISVFGWSFGSLPWWLEAWHLFLKFILAYILVRNIRGVSS